MPVPAPAPRSGFASTLCFYAQRHLRSLEVKNYSPSTVRDRTKTLRYFLVTFEEATTV